MYLKSRGTDHHKGNVNSSNRNAKTYANVNMNNSVINSALNNKLQPQAHSTTIKIPPLNLPVPTNILAVSSRSNYPSAIGQLRKLAGSLGESFVTVELGCLLANKRTQQIDEFRHND